VKSAKAKGSDFEFGGFVAGGSCGAGVEEIEVEGGAEAFAVVIWRVLKSATLAAFSLINSC
jgi:hypothetical protein